MSTRRPWSSSRNVIAQDSMAWRDTTSNPPIDAERARPPHVGDSSPAETPAGRHSAESPASSFENKMLSIVQNAFALSSGSDCRYLVPTSAKYCSFVSQTTQLFIGSRNASNRICTCGFFLSLALVRNRSVAIKKAVFWRIAISTGYFDFASAFACPNESRCDRS
jgi:putative component of membrane protein insertase Oxa1/YidC/SpoIIIJ protein YidD